VELVGPSRLGLAVEESVLREPSSAMSTEEDL